MGKRSTTRRPKRPTPSREEERALDTRRRLERAVRLERTIKRLCRELRRAVTSSDDALRAIARMVVERDMPTEGNLRETAEDLQSAGAGAAVESRG